MNNLIIDMGIASLLSLLKHYIPNDAEQKSKWKKAVLKVFKAIKTAYSDDKDFQ